MKKYVLIVNPSGRLSACPTAKAFKRGNYLTDAPLRLFEVTMREAVHGLLWHGRDDAFILAPGLPEPTGFAHRFRVTNGQLVPEATPDQIDESYGSSLTADACIYPFCKGGNREQGEAIQPV